MLYQIENELASTGSDAAAYMQHLYDKVRSDGITVPIFHNDKGRNGLLGAGRVHRRRGTCRARDLYALRRLPGRHVPTSDATPARRPPPPDWGYYGPGGATGGARRRPNTPGFDGRVRRRLVRPWGDKLSAATATRAWRSARAAATSATST